MRKALLCTPTLSTFTHSRHSNRFRYYSPELGRYISADPIGQAGGVNPFAYADLNPLRVFDLLGLSPESDLAEVIQFFRKCHGQLFHNSPQIEFDEGLEQDQKLGTTNTFTGNIRLNPNQSQDSLAGTAAHELQHSAEGLTGRLHTRWQDLTDPEPATGVGQRHGEIFSKEFELQQDFLEWKRRKDETGCDECRAEDCVCKE